MIDRGNVVGVAIGSSPGTVVGGTIAGAGNLISGNQTGVYIFAGSHQSIDGLYNAVVQGNTIGMNVDLSAALANDTGVRLNNSDNLIGGPGLAANVIAGNVFNGVAIHSPGTVRNHLKSIYAKLGVASHAELFALFFRALQAGSIPPGEDPLCNLS